VSAPASFLQDVIGVLERERSRAPQEAPWELTKAYAQLLIANGFARIGQLQRGRTLVAEAEAVLEPLAKGELAARASSLHVHSYLLAVFRQRFADACAHLPRTTRLARTVLETHDGLDRVTRYKVDRFAELTHTVSPNGQTGTTDPIGSWIRRETNELATAALSAVDLLRELEPAARAEQIATSLNNSLPAPEQLALMRAFVELPDAAALPLLASIVARARDASPQVQAMACYAAVRYGFSELAAPMFAALEDALERAQPSDDLAAILCPLLRAKRWLHAVTDLARSLERLWEAIPDDAASVPTLMVVAAGLSAAPRDLRLSELFDEQLDTSTHGTLPVCLDQAKSLAAIATYSDLGHGRDLLRRLALRHWRITTDGYGTNSHFCISVLQLVETLVLAHVDLTLANVNVLDPEQQALLSSGFAF